MFQGGRFRLKTRNDRQHHLYVLGLKLRDERAGVDLVLSREGPVQMHDLCRGHVRRRQGPVYDQAALDAIRSGRQ
jgi:hypothetical protein